jgi:hypothetical protein
MLVDPVKGTVSFDVQVLGSFAVAMKTQPIEEELVTR